MSASGPGVERGRHIVVADEDPAAVQSRPNVPVIYLANTGRSSPELEAKLPADVPILREPFTVENLRAAVDAMLDGKRDGGRS